MPSHESGPFAGVAGSVVWILGRLRRRATPVLEFALAFWVLNLILLGPLGAWILRLFLQRWGRVSVGNFEIATFFLSPNGLAALVCVGAVSLATLYLELAGLMRLLGDGRLSWWEGLTGPLGALPRLVELGVLQLAVYLLMAVPFLAIVGLVYWWLWSARDLNGLLILRPRVFWVGVVLAAVPCVVYASLAFWLFLRWLFAVPTVLHESGTRPFAALRRSTERTRGRLTVLAVALLCWIALDALLAAGVLALLRAVSGWILDRADSRLAVALPATAGLLALHALTVGALAVLGTVSFAALVLALYRWAVGDEHATDWEPGPLSAGAARPRGWLVLMALALLAGLSVVTGLSLVRHLSLEDRIEITAHRAGAIRGPENTVAALRVAIEDRADWAEIDVQRTADDALVVTHDSDLARLGGGPKAVRQTTLAEIQTLDAGSKFGPSFAGERVPTFEAVLAAAGQAIRLNVELKPHGADDVAPLTERVVAAVRRAGMVDRCRVCSQSYEALRTTRRLEPRLPIGFIAGAAIGDLSRLDVDFLMVRGDLATRSLVDRAAVHRTAVHAWTINDPAWLARLLDRGVANVITDDPAAMRAGLQELRGLGTVQRLLLRVRNELID